VLTELFLAIKRAYLRCWIAALDHDIQRTAEDEDNFMHLGDTESAFQMHVYGQKLWAQRRHLDQKLKLSNPT
jgi:hypothetical protein